MKKKSAEQGKKKRIGLYAAAAVVGVSFFVFAQSGEKEEKQEKKVGRVSEIYTESYQESVRQRLDTAEAEEDYTEDSMLIEQNPFGTNTLSLYVYFKTEEPARVSYNISVKEEDIGDFSAVPASEENAETVHEFQVIGLVPDVENKVTFTITYEDGTRTEREYTTDELKISGEEEKRLAYTDENSSESLSNGLYVILGNDSDEMDYMYYYDNDGVLRGEVPLIGYRSHRLLFRGGLMFYSISETKIAAVNSLGMAEKIYDTGQFDLHHDYVFDSDGNLLVLATDTKTDSVEDQIIRIDAETGEITGVLDMETLFPDYKEECKKNSDGELDWMHLNTLQYLEDETIIISSRETSSIIKISSAFTEPRIEYMIGSSSFWKGTEYEDVLLNKDESAGTFSDTAGQHAVTYEEGEKLQEGQYYLYMFDNNFGMSESRDFDWNEIEGVETSVKEGKISYYRKYLIDEKNRTYQLVQSFEVPFSAYVSSAQQYGGNIIIDSGMQGIFGEYDKDGCLIREYTMKLAKNYIYRVLKYDFSEFLTFDVMTGGK